MKWLLLPDEILDSLLFHWLELKDLARLDSSLCVNALAMPDSPDSSETCRQLLLKHLASDFTVHHLTSKVSSADQLSWVVARRIHIWALAITMRSEHLPLLVDLFAYSGNVISQINITSPVSESKDVNITLCTALSHKCENLRDLQVLFLSDEIVEVIAAHCHKLQTISPLESLSDRGVQALAANCPLLTSVRFMGNAGLSDASLVPLFQNCCNLNSIELSWLLTITDATVIAIAHSTTHLRSLVMLSCSPQLTDAGLVAVAQQCSNIECLILSGFGDDAVVAVALGCPKLQTCELCDCAHMTDYSIRLLVDYCIDLTKVEIIYSSGFENTLITDRGISAFARCRKLKTLIFAEITNVGDCLLSALGSSNNHRIVNLHLMGCAAVTDAGLIALAAGCTALEELILRECGDNFTDTGVIAVAQN